MLTIENLYKSYQDRPILNSVNLSIRNGEIIGIIGPSGTGKTTLIRCLNNLEEIDNGRIILEDGHSMGLVFQEYNLFPHKTALENIIEAPIYVRGENRERTKIKAEKILKDLDIWSIRDSYPSKLSGGEKQRVAIARAIILEPSILCLDEPTSALDPQSIEGLKEIIKELSKRDISLLIISHDLDFVYDVSHRILTLDKGSLNPVADRF